MTPLGKARFGLALLLWAGNLPVIGQSQPSLGPAGAIAALELIHDKPYVQVMVNGRGPYRFLIDTGTGTQALVSPELVHELGMPVIGHARLTDGSRQGEQRSEMVWIESLRIGALEFEEVQAVQHRLFREEQNCQGVLGFPLFADYLLTLDYPGRRMIVTSGVMRDSSAGTLLPFRLSDGVPVADLQIGGLTLDAQIDSGGTGLSLPDAVAEQLQFQSPPVEFGTAESLTTRFTLKAARLRPDVRLGAYIFRKAFVEINSAFPVVNVGSTPLKNFVITFDQQELVMRVYSRDRIMNLDASPVLMQLQNEPQHQASDPQLVPVG